MRLNSKHLHGDCEKEIKRAIVVGYKCVYDFRILFHMY